MVFHDPEDFLISLPRFSELGAEAYKPGLERIEVLLDALGNPHHDLAVAHVAGTNGKGSTASFVSAILSAAGYRVGLFTSPHISTIRERFRIDGQMISIEDLGSVISKMEHVFDDLAPSFFEAVTATAFRYFRDQHVDIAVIEVGLGGRLDATNVVDPELSIITSIGYDHTDLLGETLEEIAVEKAGIIKPDLPVVTAVDGASYDAIAGVARNRGSRLHSINSETSYQLVSHDNQSSTINLETPMRSYRNLKIGLPGSHQLTNAVLAVRASELLSNFYSDVFAVAAGLEEVASLSGLNSRLQIVQDDPPIIFDVGHNVEGIRAALEHVSGTYPGQDIHMSFSMMSDKNIDGVLDILVRHQVFLYPIQIDSVRAISAEMLTIMAEDRGLNVRLDVPLESFLSMDYDIDGVRLVIGSHYLVEMARDVLKF